MATAIALSEIDLKRLHNRHKQSRSLSRILLCGSVLLPTMLSSLLYITPLDFESTALYLAGGLSFLFSSPFLFLFWSLKKQSSETQTWILGNQKKVLNGDIAEKDLQSITVNDLQFPLWNNAPKLSIGQSVTIEYFLSKQSGKSKPVILRVNEQNNPNFETVTIVEIS